MVYNYDQQRRKYLNGTLSHEEFYLDLADAIAFDDLATLVPKTAFKSRDHHLNDLPLNLWDYRFSAVKMLLIRSINQGHVIKRTNGLSAVESVCTLKTVARECTASQLIQIKNVRDQIPLTHEDG